MVAMGNESARPDRGSVEPAEVPVAATVVIASRDRSEMLRDAVASVLQGRRVPSQVVVVDQSVAPQRELMEIGTERGCRVDYVHSAVPGVSRGRNIGLRHATQDIVVILDDDVLMQDDTLELLVAECRDHGSRTVATGRLLAAPPERPGLSQPPGALVTRSTPDVFRGRQPHQVIPGPNIAVPRAVFLDIDGYDERLGPGTRFPAAEDHDLSLRLLDAGCEVRHVPGAVALHRSWRTRRDVARLRWGYARGVGAFYAKHASLHDRHVLERAARDVGKRVREAVACVSSAPAGTARQLLTLFGMLVGAVEWSLRFRVGGHRGLPSS